MASMAIWEISLTNSSRKQRKKEHFQTHSVRLVLSWYQSQMKTTKKTTDHYHSGVYTQGYLAGSVGRAYMTTDLRVVS